MLPVAVSFAPKNKEYNSSKVSTGLQYAPFVLISSVSTSLRFYTHRSFSWNQSAHLQLLHLNHNRITLQLKRRRPNHGIVGGNNFVKIKCLRRRPALIQSALCFPDLGECFTYPEHVFSLSRKFSRVSQSQNFQKNT